MAIAEYLSLGTTYRYCPWIKGKQAYLGLKFVVKGKVHFGWARVKILTGFTGFPAKNYRICVRNCSQQTHHHGKDEPGQRRIRPTRNSVLVLP